MPIVSYDNDIGQIKEISTNIMNIKKYKETKNPPTPLELGVLEGTCLQTTQP